MQQEFKPGDRVVMRKAHPCGSTEWIIYRIGADIGMRCTRCGRRVMLERAVFVKRLKAVLPAAVDQENPR